MDGLQIVGMHFSESADPGRFRSILQGAALDRGRAAVLLCHAPHHLAIAEQEGISLQLSGHTHGGQFFPFTLHRLPHLWPVRPRPAAPRQSDGLRHLGRRDLGAAAARRDETRNLCCFSFRVSAFR